MLFKIRPGLRLDLVQIIKNCLFTYNLSIEEQPFYLRGMCGIERVKLAISEVEEISLFEQEKIILNTFKFWLGLRENGYQLKGAEGIKINPSAPFIYSWKFNVEAILVFNVQSTRHWVGNEVAHIACTLVREHYHEIVR